MAEGPSLEFDASTSFLRRLSRRSHLRDRVVSADAFVDKHPTLSLTFRDERLRSDAGLQAYREAKRLQYGDLPGLCELTYPDLTQRVFPPLPPWHERDPDDPSYGESHCNTDKPSSAQAEQMAALATRNSVLIPLTRAKRK